MGMWCTRGRRQRCPRPFRGDGANMCCWLPIRQALLFTIRTFFFCSRQLPNQARGNRHDLMIRTAPIYRTVCSGKNCPCRCPLCIIVVEARYTLSTVSGSASRATAAATRTTIDCCSRCSIDAFSMLHCSSRPLYLPGTGI